jgi:hypothetical protein
MKPNPPQPEGNSGLKTIGVVVAIIVGITGILTWLGIGPFSHAKSQPAQFITTSGNNSPAFNNNGNISGNVNVGNGTQIINPTITTGEKLVNWAETLQPGSSKELIKQMAAGANPLKMRLPIMSYNRLVQIAN